MGLLLTISQRVHLLFADPQRTCDPQLIIIDYQLQVELATVMNEVNNGGHEIAQLKGHSPHAIADGDIGNLFHLFDNFLEEEVPLFPGHFGQGIAISVDLSGDRVLTGFRVMLVRIIIFRLHSYKKI
jgi:hypothetical protein